MEINSNVPYIVYESAQVKHERTVRRLIVALIVCVVLLAGTNLAWLRFFSQFDFSVDTIMQDTTDGDNSYIGASGVITNGTTDSNTN